MPDVHSHKCKCGRIWTHARLVNVPEEEYEEAHTCHECGRVQYVKHLEPKQARELLLRFLLEYVKELERDKQREGSRHDRH